MKCLLAVMVVVAGCGVAHLEKPGYGFAGLSSAEGSAYAYAAATAAETSQRVALEDIARQGKILEACLAWHAEGRPLPYLCYVHGYTAFGAVYLPDELWYRQYYY